MAPVVFLTMVMIILVTQKRNIQWQPKPGGTDRFIIKQNKVNQIVNTIVGYSNMTDQKICI